MTYKSSVGSMKIGTYLLLGRFCLGCTAADADVGADATGSHYMPAHRFPLCQERLLS